MISTHSLPILIITLTIVSLTAIFLWLYFISPEIVTDTNLDNSRRRRLQRELRRKSFHFIGYIYPVLYYIIISTKMGTKRDVVLLSAIVCVIVQLLELNRVSGRNPVTALNRNLLRSSEQRELAAIFYTVLGNMLTILLVSTPSAIIGLTNAVLGDLTASLVGVTWGRHRLVRKKSIEGSLGCLIVCFLVNLHFLTYFMLFPITSAMLVAGLTSVTTTLSELFATDGLLGDNLIIPIFTSVSGDFALKTLLGIKRPNILSHRF
ncbi:hypothetical protein GEMRC1_006574 [Eukaryota sp. GEM-RC1]